jgi:putative transposase
MLLVNQIVESVLREEPFEEPARVLWVRRDLDLVTFMTLSEKLRAPWSMSLQEAESMMTCGNLRLRTVRVPSYMLRVEEDLSDKARKLRERRWDIVKDLLEGPDKEYIYRPRALGNLVAAHSEKIGKPEGSIYRLLYLYWAQGMSKNAFLDKYRNSGAPGKTREFLNGKKPGRPRLFLGEKSGSSAKLLTADDKEIIKVSYALYQNNKVKYITHAYTKMLERFYRAEHPAPSGLDDGRPLKPLDEIPNERQFDYWGKKAFDEMAVSRGRKGERKWALDYRALAGTAYQGLSGPCHRFEIDATIADIYLVSRFNRNWIIGRPVVYVVIDVFSRMIVGVHVALEGPSWNSARHTLFNAFTDKVAFCASYGVTIKTEEWPCHHLPRELVGDRGEMISSSPESTAEALKMTLVFPPPFRADWKGTVESTFRIVNNLTQIHWTPGAVRSREKERGERDYRLDATLDLQEFTAIVIKAILHYNHHSRDPGRLTKEMIQQDVEPTPIAIWNWAAELGIIEPNVQPRESIYLHLLPKTKASVRAGGIYFNGMAYINVLDPSGKRSALARAKGRGQIDIWHEPFADHIWIMDEENSFVKCPLRASEARNLGMRREEVLDMLAIKDAVSIETKYAELNSKVQLDEFIENTISTAAAEKAEAESPSSKAEKLRGIRPNRQLERDTERVLAAERSPVAPQKNTPPKEAERSVSSSVSEYAGDRGAEVISLLSRAGKLGAKK